MPPVFLLQKEKETRYKVSLGSLYLSEVILEVVIDLDGLTSLLNINYISVYYFHYVVGTPASAIHDVLIRNTDSMHDRCAIVPLRYNYDKPEKPRISRAFGYLARFFILFQTEKSSREVVIS